MKTQLSPEEIRYTRKFLRGIINLLGFLLLCGVAITAFAMILSVGGAL